MAQIKIHRRYNYVGKDPVIEEARTMIRDEGLIKRLGIVAQLADISVSTLHGWLDGETISPINRTICAVTSALGYKRAWTKEKDFDLTNPDRLDKELKIAARWMERQNSGSKKAKPVKRANGQPHRGAPSR